MQSRWKSPVLWTAIISTVILVARALGWVQIDDTATSNVVNVILTTLIAFGIVNNPASKNTL
jgi:uncharacterized membrane protein